MNFEKFIKLMSMTTSPHDGECLNAIRMANAELASIDKTWEEVLRGKVKVTNGVVPKPRGRGFEDVASGVDELFEKAFHNVKPNSSFYGFLMSVHSWYEKHGHLTMAQYSALRKAAER